MRLLPFLLALLAVVAVAGAVSEFRHALTIWHIDRSVAFTVLAATLTVASIRTELYTRSHASTSQFPARSAVTVVLCFAASLIAIWAGCGTLFETLELCNQEYLHWLPQNQPKLFPIATGLAIAASATIGIVFLAIGFFLFWFLFFRRSKTASVGIQPQRLGLDSNPNVSLDPNPYAPPRQSS
jgi:hypothetical protein